MMHIIVQAGGRGSRLRHHTWNKPKCLVSVHGKPILYHLFDKFPDASYLIIGNYLFNFLENYLKINPPKVKFELIKATEDGTCAGISKCATLIEDDVLLVWGDLLFQEKIQVENKNTLYTTDNFTCRYRANSKIEKEVTGKDGVLGIFYFTSAKILESVPDEGEFVEWYRKHITSYTTKKIDSIEEIGDFSSLELKNKTQSFCRYFNSVEILESTVIKKAIDNDYQHLLDKEINWYKIAEGARFDAIPKILKTSPLTMTKISGSHMFEMYINNDAEKKVLLRKYIDKLNELHSLKSVPVLKNELQEVYVEKTKARVNQIKTIIPNFERKEITINGLKCKNIFVDDDWSFVDKLQNITSFNLLHGDPTFSNTLIDKNNNIWFIDPRGYFSKTPYGDSNYDFAKLYYSAVGGYDLFNRKKFKLYIDEDTAELMLEPTGFEHITDEIFLEKLGSHRLNQIKIIHGLLWLSLSGYALDDIDSILGSFYYGLYWLTLLRISRHQTNHI